MYESEIKHMQTAAKRIESDVSKGRKPSDEDCQSVCSSYKNVVDGLSNSYPDEDFQKEIDSRCYQLSPLLVPFYIKEIIVDMADLAKKAFALMLENMRTPSKPKDPKPKANEPVKRENNYDMAQNNKKRKKGKILDFGYEGSEQDKMSVQQRNNLKISGKYSGSLDNVVTAQSREQKAMVERQAQAQTNAVAHELATSEPEQSMSMSND